MVHNVELPLNKNIAWIRVVKRLLISRVFFTSVRGQHHSRSIAAN